MHFSLESVFGFTVPFVFFPTTKTLKPFNTGLWNSVAYR